MASSNGGHPRDRHDDDLEAAMALMGDGLAEVVGVIEAFHDDAVGRLDDLAELPSGGGGGGGENIIGGQRTPPGGRRPAGGASAASGQAMALMGTAFGKIAGALAPIALLGTALHSATSGFQQFMKSIQLLGVTLGGVLMPGMVVLSAVTYAAAMMMSGELMPAMETFTRTILTDADTVISGFSDALKDATDGLNSLGVSTDALIKVLTYSPLADLLRAGEKSGVSKGDMLKAIGIGLLGPAGQAFAHGFGKGSAKPGEAQEPGDFRSGLSAGGGEFGDNTIENATSRDGKSTREQRDRDFAAIFREGLGMISKSMRMAIGSQGGFTGLVQAQKEAITAGLNQDPYQQKILDAQLKQIAMLEKIVGEMQKQPVENQR